MVMLRLIKFGVLAAVTLLVAPHARGQCVPTVCALTIILQSDASGLTLGGSGSSAATMSFGTMQAFGGTTPTGATKTLTATNFTISSPFDVKVTCSNLLTLLPCTILVSPTYILTAQLQSTDAINTWKIGSTTLSSASPITLTSSGTYGMVTSYTLGLTIPFTESFGGISNTVNFFAVAN